MKRNFAIALLALSTLAATGKAVAQESALQATMPFEFTVGGRLLPAGTYNITSPDPGVIMVQSIDRQSAVLTTTSHSNRQSAGAGKLIFDKYGNQYFLHQIVCPTAIAMNVTMHTSKLERQVQLQEARYGGEPEVVLIASR
jgi:hypothetical protein